MPIEPNDKDYKIVKVQDPRLNIDKERTFAVIQGPQVNNWQVFPATNVSVSTVQVTCNPPSADIAISRKVKLQYNATLTIAGTIVGGSATQILTPKYYALRCQPFTSCINSQQFTINNDTVSVAPLGQFYPALLWYNNDYKNRSGDNSMAPSYLDQYQDYLFGEDGVSPQVGSSRNPLGLYDDNAYEYARGSYNSTNAQIGANIGLTVVSNTATSAVVNVIVTEYAAISPFVSGDNSEDLPALIGVNNMSYTATFSNLANVLSMVQSYLYNGSTITITSVTPQLNSFSLLFQYLTPQITEKLPKQLISSYNSPVLFPTVGGKSVSTSSRKITITCQNIQLQAIPRFLVVFARYQEAYKTPFVADSYLAFDASTNPFSLLWNNNTYFSTATSQDLFQMSRANGNNMSWVQWSNYTGSVLMIKPGIDFGLAPDQGPSSIGNYQLQVTGNFLYTGNDSVGYVPQLSVVAIYEGVYKIGDGIAAHCIGGITAREILDAIKVENPDYFKKVESTAYGTGLFDTIKKGFNYAKEHKLLSKALDLVPDARAKSAAKVAKELGLGVVGGRDDMLKRRLRGY